MTMHRTRGVAMASLAWAALAATFVACTDNRLIDDQDADTETGSASTEATTQPTPSSATDTGADDTSDTSDTGTAPTTDEPPPEPDCTIDGDCPTIDLLFVIDNSGTMGDEQLALSDNVGAIVQTLQTLTDRDGVPAQPDVNIMVTTTDVGHPLCTAFNKPDYTPAEGAPIYSGCNLRINRFTGLDPMSPVVVTEACTNNCPADIVAADHFVHFDALGSNVPDDDVQAALACMLPQGIDGCGYESPLEAMIQALDPSKCWNDPGQPACDEDPEWADVDVGFLRPGGILGVVFFTDELDCSVAAPGGYSFFTDVNNTIYWNINPDLEVPQATSAVCFNAGVTCEDVNDDGLYESCATSDTGALHPVHRYTSYLQYLVGQGKQVVMMGGLGVPPVVAHNPEPSYEPTAGGLVDLQYRTWIDGPYPGGDIDPDGWSDGTRAEDLAFAYGDLGPGCHRVDATGDYLGSALLPVRIREVCESLDTVDEEGTASVRCCMESICGDDFSAALRCLTGVL